MGLKNLVVNRPAFHLSEQNYFLYIIFISKILNLFGFSYSLKAASFSTKFSQDVKVWRIDGLDRPIMIQSQYRISRFMKGFENAGRRQWNRYGISDLIGSELPDTVIDVGANVGEVSFFANSLGISRIIAVEPDPIVRECLSFNLNGTNIELDIRALGEKSGDVTFYSQARSADSSLFKPSGNFREIMVQSITLDEFFFESQIAGDVLFKMDAEGFEPEILRGGLQALRSIRWIAVDAGAERGNETTVSEVVKILEVSGFKSVKVSTTNIVTASRG